MLGAEGLSVEEAAERLRIPRGTLYEEIKRDPSRSSRIMGLAAI
jgi:excisionase family DNA binding protein